MLVAVDDVQLLAAHERQHLTHCCLACACVSNQQGRLAVLHTPESSINQSVILKLLGQS